MTNIAEVGGAITALAGVFGDGMTADMVGASFTCSEADTVARLLALAGHKSEALTWLEGHAQGDEVDDSHYTYDETDPEDEGRVLTEAELVEYIEGLTA
ncbi:hypothetical protein SEA_ISSMI_73 [Streptomyces phage Issmi]|uniref:Uncharacterized protein n=1 Tax=Streptomyces phage Issmi TaxID=2725628 RepID=A0A6M3SYK0_9CAUD|nr:hypothetical protein KGG87_gp73 [Streptomyces phage Issmi]QJD50719.1 hypothetical protein SEA_ISSMI_73 [Streptomyces phage Issmi]